MNLLLNNKIRRVLLLFIIIIVSVCGCIVYLSFTTIDVSNQANIIKYIKEQNNIRSGAIEIKTQDTNKNLLAIYYSIDNSKNSNIIILEQNKFFKNRYSYFGSSETHNLFDAFMLQTSEYSLIIAYGNNSEVNADHYIIETTDTTDLEKNINNQDYITDIYILSPDINPKSNVKLFNEKNEKISIY